MILNLIVVLWGHILQKRGRRAYRLHASDSPTNY